jgi:protein phosphatase
MQAAGLKDPGIVRESNEDEFYVQVAYRSDGPTRGLLVVADGIGGHQAGEVASRMAVEHIKRHFADWFAPTGDPKQTRRLTPGNVTRKLDELQNDLQTDLEPESKIRSALTLANRSILNYAEQHPAAAGLGTTVTMALVQGASAWIANVGDSRAYLLHDGKLTQITHDHSVVANLIAAGQLEADAVYTHPKRNLIFRSLGGHSGVEVDLFPVTLAAGDSLVLCSDGLWEMVRDDAIAATVTAAPSVEDACRNLVDLANANGGEDNIAVVVARFAG